MPNELERGKIVYDKEDADPDPAIIISIPPEATAKEWDVGEDRKLAEDNPDYSEDAQVILVAFINQLEEELDDWRENRKNLYPKVIDKDNDLGFYAFPEPRLTTQRRIDRIKEELDDFGKPIIKGDKIELKTSFGEYEISEDGEVSGEGALKPKIEAAIERLS